MGRRVLAFFLGLLFGIILIVGGIAAAIYVTVCVVEVDRYIPNAEKYLGDLSHKSAYDIAKEIYRLYKEKIGVTDENDQYYTMGQFFANYGIDINAAVGMQLPQEVLDMPAFEFFSDGGVQRAMKQIKVSTLPAIINMFGGTDEDGNPKGMIGQNAVKELANFSLYDLFNDEVGVSGVFANVKLCDLMPSIFPAEDGNNKVMWALGETKAGRLLGGLKNENMMLHFKEGGAFETLGGLQLTTVFGDNQYLRAIMGGNATLADLIDNEGNIDFDKIVSEVSLGEMLGCQKRPVENTDDYEIIIAANEESRITVKAKTDGEKTLYVMSADGEKWFEAELHCDVKNDEAEEQTHTHTADCYGYVWYSATPRSGAPESTDWIDGEKAYPKTTGLYSVLSNLTVKDLTSGNDNALMNKIKKLTVSDIIGDTEVSGVMSNLVHLTIEELMGGAIDKMLLGEFFGYFRKGVVDLSAYGEITELTYKNGKAKLYVRFDENNNVALSEDKESWYEGVLDCDETDAEHAHTADCYVFNWYKDADCTHLADGIQGAFANKHIADLTNLNEEVKKLTLGEVLSPVPQMLAGLSHTPIGELGNAINDLYAGELLSFYRAEAELDGSHITDLSDENQQTVAALAQLSDGTYIMRDNGTEIWYKATFVCRSTEHANHNFRSCYCYAWYTNKELSAEADGMMTKIADKKVGKLNTLSSTIKTFTISDVLTPVPSMLKAIANTPIGQISEAINKMYFGDFLEYEKVYKNCDQQHEHTDECQFDWYQKCNKDDHSSCENEIELELNGENAKYVLVEGMMGKLAYNKVNELNSLNQTIKKFTLRDVLGNVPDMFVDVADTPIGELSGAIEAMYLGSAMGYHREVANNLGDYPVTLFENVKSNLGGDKFIKTEDGEIWYEADLDCYVTESDHAHTADCYKYVWYNKDGSLVTGVARAFVNNKLNNVGGSMNDLTLRKLGINSDGNNLLKTIENMPIMEIGEHINSVHMGEVLGYRKHYTCGFDENENHAHTDNCYIWVEECTNNHNTSQPNNHNSGVTHYPLDGKNYVEVKGLNSKIAVKTVKEMTGAGLTDIAVSLTVGDLIDSGMMSLGTTSAEIEENEYKFDIVFDNSNKCSLKDYFIYVGTETAAGRTASAKKYYTNKHGADETYRYAWKELPLSQFITTVLGAF